MIIKELPWHEPNCTITHGGHEFSRGGVRIDEFELYAYVGAQIDPRPGEPPLHVLTNWHGERIAWCYVSGLDFSGLKVLPRTSWNLATCRASSAEYITYC